MAFQRLNVRHATKAIVNGIVSVVPDPPTSWPATPGINRIKGLSLPDASTITQDEIAFIGGVSMSQLAAGDCDAFDPEKASFWNRILDIAEEYWKNPTLYPIINGLKADGTPDPDGKKRPFDRSKFPIPTLKCDVAGDDTACREVSLALINLWKKAQADA